MTTLISAPEASPNPKTTGEKIAQGVTGCLSIIVAVPLSLFFMIALVQCMAGRSTDPSRVSARDLTQPPQAQVEIPGIGPWTRFENAARAQVRPCRQTDQSNYNFCQLHREMFIRMYVLALTGDSMYAYGIAEMLGPRTEYQDRFFYSVPYQPANECVWRLYEARTRADPADAQKRAAQACAVLTPAKRAEARRAVDVLARTVDIHAHPPSGWRPDVGR